MVVKQGRPTEQRHKRLIEMPGVICLASGRFQAVRKACTESVVPASDHLVRHDQAALEEQLLDDVQAQLKEKIPTYGALMTPAEKR